MANIDTQVAVVGKDRSRRANSPRKKGDRFYQLKISSSDADPKARKDHLMLHPMSLMRKANLVDRQSVRGSRGASPVYLERSSSRFE